MPASHALAARRWQGPVACLLLLYGLGAQPAASSDAHAPEPKAAAPKKGEDSRAKADTPAPRSGKDEAAKPAKAAPQDPMDKLRERLAEKLGATPASNAHTVRVAARSPEPSAAPGHRPAVAPAAKSRTQHVA